VPIHAASSIPAPRTLVRDAERFICSCLRAQAFLFVGYLVVTDQTRAVVPRDFENAAGFEVLPAPRRK